jgi:uncharacterized phage-like protein YoqJ
VYRSGVTHFICGMANGCDMYFAETVLRLRTDTRKSFWRPPSHSTGRPDRWGTDLRARYAVLLSQCDAVTPVGHEYSPDCMMRRNRYMVDSSDVVVACFDGTPGGTMNTLLYAMRQKKEVIQIPIE